MKILFIGCVESSYRLLSRLIFEHKNVVGVLTKKKSKFNSDFYDLSPLCKEHGIPCFYVNNVNDEDSLTFIRKQYPDLCFCFGWSQLLKEELINIFPLGVVGFHPAALPNNRGRHPLIWALALGLEATASSFFMINVGADEGDIISQRKITIAYEDDARTLYDKVINVAVDQEIEIINAFETDHIVRVPQNVSHGNTWRKRCKRDGEIDWRMSSRGIYNLVRSITKPYVGAHFVLNGHEYKVWKVRELSVEGVANIEPGKVLSVNQDGTVDVRVFDGAIRLLEFDHFAINTGDYIV
jgi:methionyl-tRNA formyltransferase